MSRPFRFGVVVRSASSAKEWADKARMLEGGGVDVLLVPDHLVGRRFAPIAALTAAACATTRLRVGTLVFANDYRHPTVLAKETASLDVLSDGRLEVGLGTGWMAADYNAAGLELSPPGTRIDRLVETIAILRGLWTGEPFSYKGTHHTLTELRQEPATLQRPHPPILLGGGGARMLRLAAAEADIVNLTMRVRPDGTGPDPDDGGLGAFIKKIDILRSSPRADQIELGTSVIEIGDPRSRPAWSAADTSRQDDTPQILRGGLADMTAKLRSWRDTYGLSYYVLHNEDDLAAFMPLVAELAGR